jgi:formylglycine-generating enzyme required for sulfatase activity
LCRASGGAESTMRLAAAIAFVLATVLGAMQGRALIRAALVIDDAGDQNAHVLPNPINDARDIAEFKMVIAADQEATTPLSAAEERVLKPKDNFKECAQCPEIVVVPAGSFTMGSPDSEEGRIEEEGPQHRVTFGKSFGVGKFAVTFEEWDACVADGGCNGYAPSDEGWGRGRRPVINVSWEDAKAYVVWLSRKTGKSYRLLSEAEREYVTRAGTTTPFWWGASISTQQANYNGNYTYGTGATGVSRRQTVPVNSFQPNPWGLYQVHGNVWEWTEDCWHDDYLGAPSDGSAWTSGGCSDRVIRGGAWYFYPWLLRAAFRIWNSANGRDNVVGFRLGRTLSP